jgi:hypothetical protein
VDMKKGSEGGTYRSQVTFPLGGTRGPQVPDALLIWHLPTKGFNWRRFILIVTIKLIIIVLIVIMIIKIKKVIILIIIIIIILIVIITIKTTIIIMMIMIVLE